MSAVPASLIKRSVVHLSSGDILALDSAYKDIVPSPGSGKWIVPLQVAVRLVNVGSAYAFATDVHFYYGGSDEFTVPELTPTFEGITDMVGFYTFPDYSRYGTTVDSGSFAIGSDGAVTSGDGDAYVELLYAVRPVAV